MNHNPIVLTKEHFKLYYNFPEKTFFPLDKKIFDFAYSWGGHFFYPLAKDTKLFKVIKKAVSQIMRRLEVVSEDRELRLRRQLDILSCYRDFNFKRIKVSEIKQKRTLRKIETFLFDFQSAFTNKKFYGKVTPGMILKFDLLKERVRKDFSEDHHESKEILVSTIDEVMKELIYTNMTRVGRKALMQYALAGKISKATRKDVLGPALYKQHTQIRSKYGNGYKCVQGDQVKQALLPDLPKDAVRTPQEYYQELKTIIKDMLEKESNSKKRKLYLNILNRAEMNLECIKKQEEILKDPKRGEKLKEALLLNQIKKFNEHCKAKNYDFFLRNEHTLNNAFKRYQSGDTSVKLKDPGEGFYQIAKSTESMELLIGMASQCDLTLTISTHPNYKYTKNDLDNVKESLCRKIFEIYYKDEQYELFLLMLEPSKREYIIDNFAPVGWSEWSLKSDLEKEKLIKEAEVLTKVFNPVTIPAFYHATTSEEKVFEIFSSGFLKKHRAQMGNGVFVGTKYEPGYGRYCFCLSVLNGWGSTPVNAFVGFTSGNKRSDGSYWIGFRDNIPIDQKLHYLIVKDDESDDDGIEEVGLSPIRQLFDYYIGKQPETIASKGMVSELKRKLKERGYEIEVISYAEYELEREAMGYWFNTPWSEPNYYKGANP